MIVKRWLAGLHLAMATAAGVAATSATLPGDAATAGPATADSSATYGYDADGRVRSVLYDNNLCIAYDYDANGNRTSQNNTASSTPETPTWGTGTWGCFKWTAP